MKLVASLILASVFAVSCGSPPPAFPPAEFAPGIAIAPLDEALTFARTTVDGAPHLLAVTAYEGETVTAIDLTQAKGAEVTDPVTLFNEYGYDLLRDFIASHGDVAETVAVESLILPLKLRDTHIAAGTNFAAHAEEAEVEDGPFLFAKYVTPTSFNAPVSAGEALLDYEVELAFVTLNDLTLPDVPETMGLILSNDVTDRATLLRHLNPDDVTSGEGFTTGKSAEGFLPVGNLFVIPRDLETFVAETEIALSVNGKLRQRAPMTMAIWDLPELLRQTEARVDTRWEHQGEDVRLPADGGIVPARTLILAGTPDGTVFQGINRGAIVRGVAGWAFGGWGDSIPDHAIESYITSHKKQGDYLQPGDTVVSRAERVGVIVTAIEE